MAREKKLEAPVTLFAAIETEQHQALREIAFEQRRSIADVVREAISQYVAKRPAKPASQRLAQLPQFSRHQQEFLDCPRHIC